MSCVLKYERRVEALEEDVARHQSRADKLAKLTKSTAAADIKKASEAQLRQLREFYHEKLRQVRGAGVCECHRTERAGTWAK